MDTTLVGLPPSPPAQPTCPGPGLPGGAAGLASEQRLKGKGCGVTGDLTLRLYVRVVCLLNSFSRPTLCLWVTSSIPPLSLRTLIC